MTEFKESFNVLFNRILDKILKSNPKLKFNYEIDNLSEKRIFYITEKVKRNWLSKLFFGEFENYKIIEIKKNSYFLNSHIINLYGREYLEDARRIANYLKEINYIVMYINLVSENPVKYSER